MKKATEDLNKVGTSKGFAHKLLTAKRLASDLRGPTDTISTLANQFVLQLHDVDDGVRAIIEQVPVEIEAEPDSKEAVCNFFDQIRGLSEESNIGVSAAREMIEALTPLEKMSRDLRPGVRRLRRALMTMVEVIKVTEIWTSLIEASGVDCR